MTEQNHTLIRFTGVLLEDLTFEHIPAWETVNVLTRPPEGDGTYTVDLLDSEARVLMRVSPLVDFRPAEDPNAEGIRFADILVYIPFHEKARTLVFRKLIPDMVEIFRAELAERAPHLGELSVEGNPTGKMAVEWQAEHDRPLEFTLFYYPEGKMPIVVATRIRESRAVVDPSSLPGPIGRFAVLASDGFRSEVVISQPIEGFTKAIRVSIDAPITGSVFPADQPIDLIASASDVSGQVVDIDKFVWSIDEKEIQEGKQALALGLAPGEHQITVRAMQGDAEVSRETVGIKIADRSPQQEEFLRRVAEIPPAPGRQAE